MTHLGRAALALVFVLTLPAAPLAHPGHPVTPGFIAGFVHPFGGLDPLVAMLLIGFWGGMNDTRRGGSVLALVTLTLCAGYVAGLSGTAALLIEIGLSGSLVVLVVLSVFRFRLPHVAGLAILGAFGLLHGFVHGLEVPPHVDVDTYGAGLMGASALLMTIGLSVWRLGGLVARLRQSQD